MAPLLAFQPPRAARARDAAPLDAEIVELAVLVPRWQAQALEEAAHENGLTPGQMLRRLIGETLGGRSAG